LKSSKKNDERLSLNYLPERIIDFTPAIVFAQTEVALMAMKVAVGVRHDPIA